MTIEDIILNYCEGNTHLEFHIDDLEEMVGRIKESVESEILISKTTKQAVTNVIENL